MNPHVLLGVYSGRKVYSIETPGGFVHVLADQVFCNLSDCLREIKGVEPEAHAVVQAAERDDKDLGVTGDVSGPEQAEG